MQKEKKRKKRIKRNIEDCYEQKIKSEKSQIIETKVIRALCQCCKNAEINKKKIYIHINKKKNKTL